jgi:hypothetical protein
LIFAYCGILPFFGPLIIVHAFFCCSVQRSSLESPSALENLKRPSARQFWGRQVLVSYKIKTHIVCLLPIETPVVPSKSGKHLAVRPTRYQFRRFHSACFFFQHRRRVLCAVGRRILSFFVSSCAFSRIPFVQSGHIKRRHSPSSAPLNEFEGLVYSSI